MFGIERKTILAIDDDITILTTIRTILGGAFEVCLANSTERASTILDTTAIDLILLDMEMPGVTGLEFLKTLRENNSFYHIPVIIVSSHGTMTVIIEGKKAGANGFVVKPIDAKVLLEKIAVVLRTSSKKINRDELIRNLSFLVAACKQKKKARVEELITELEQVCYNITVDKEIAGICKYARESNYHLVCQNVAKLVANKLYDGEYAKTVQ